MTHSSAASIIDLYERFAADWDRDRGKVLIEKHWLDLFLGGIRRGGTVLDLGCGSGDPLAAYMIKAGFCITGLDSSPSMIAMCAERFPNHAWVIGDMRAAHLGRTFDGIIAWDSFFHLTPDDQRAMFARFRDHAHRGSVLIFTSGPAAGEAIGSYRGEPLYHASLAAAEYERLLADIGFEVVAHAVQDPGCGGHTIWLARCS